MGMFGSFFIYIKNVCNATKNRQQKRLIGLTIADLEDLSYEFNINPLKEFEKVENENFFLKGEPKEVYTASKVDLKTFGNEALHFQKITPYRFKEDLLKNAKLRIGDIRKDMKKLARADENTLRIFEFANGWYFMPEKDQIKLACNLAEDENLLPKVFKHIKKLLLSNSKIIS